MKNIHILKGILFAFLAFQFFSCDNEPLEGEFPPRDEQNDSIQANFEALIDGKIFRAQAYEATISEDNYLVLRGEKRSGEKIILKVSNISAGTFQLSGGEDDDNVGLYYKESGNKPYTTNEEFGGAGTLKMDSISGVQTISGTFNMEVKRPELDAMGNPVLDDNGNPIVHSVSITEGVFKNIGFQTGSGSGSSGGNHDFMAKVDGTAFDAKTIRVIDTVIAGTQMLQIHAKNYDSDRLRVDVPIYLGTGIYEMESLSDGRTLIASYKANEGDVLTSNPGTLTIEEFDKERGLLRATFEFTATDPLQQNPETAEITEGSLKVRFEGIPGGNNTFSAVVDDQEYLPTSISVRETTVGQVERYEIQTETESQIMNLSFPQSVREGNSYPMKIEVTAGNEVNAVFSPDGEANFASETGELTITAFDSVNRRLEGVFEYEAVDPEGEDPARYIVEQGQFSITLP